MKVALTYNLKKEDGSKPPDYFSEFDSAETVNAIASALRSRGHSVESVEADNPNLFSYFKNNRVDMVFNIAEGTRGKFRESEIPAMLDLLGIPYTGSNTFSLAIALNKALTKKILKAEGIPTPAFQLFTKGTESLDPSLRFPLIVKPNCEGSAKGISRINVVRDEKTLYDRVREINSVYRQEVIVEEFIEGKELTVGILENGATVVLPILEIDFSTAHKSGEFFYSWKMKEFQGNEEIGTTPTFHCPARLDKKIEELVKDTALATHRALDCCDMSRTDIRLSKDNIPYVLEINPLPGLNPKESNFPIMVYAAGLKYDEMINAVLKSACQRRNLAHG